MRNMTHDMWQVVNIVSIFQVPSSNGLGVIEFKIFVGNGWLASSINDKGVSSTAPSTPGLVNKGSINQTPPLFGGHQTTADMKSWEALHGLDIHLVLTPLSPLYQYSIAVFRPTF